MNSFHAHPSQPAIEPPSSTTAPHDELVGRTLNDSYVVEKVLGEGGVGRVYQARHARISTKQFALKVLHAEHSRDPDQLARFQREAEAAASLSHPNVVGVFDIGRTEDGYSYLACELLHGIDLDQYLEKHGPLSVQAVVHLGLQICAALESAHERNIIHRDLKPQNVFLMSEADGNVAELPTIKLVDFGLSRMLDHADSQLTKTGTLMGTPAFMAPEQATGERGDHRVDVYGLGVILYVSLTGRAPFLEETLPAMLVAVMTEDPPRPSKLVAQVPEALELIIQKAMAKQPDERYRSIAQMREALQGVLSPESDGTKNPLQRTRFRLSSAQLAEETAYELRTSRARLLFFAFATSLAALASLSAAVSGLELFTGPLEFSRTELALIGLGLFGTIATPAVLLFRHVRKAVWSNSAKVMDSLGRLRIPLSTALIAYGGAVIALRLGDDFLGRIWQSELFQRSPGVAWPGFTWILPLAAAMAGGLSYLKVRLAEGELSPRARMMLGAPLRLLSIAVVAATLYAGLRWRAHEAAVAVAIAPEAAAPAPLELPSAPDTAPPAESPSTAVVARASDDELASAIALGVDGLLPLSEKYPQDPRVLEPLFLDFASRATGFADAMETAKRLIALEPEKRDNESLGIIVRRAAETPGKAADAAFELMERHLGSTGADLLYQLSKSSSKSAERASKALATADVQENLSPALRIALQLEQAPDCAARLPLLERAKYLGDSRSSLILTPLARGTKTGCGKWKNRPCPAQCKTEAQAYLDAAQLINQRASGTKL